VKRFMRLGSIAATVVGGIVAVAWIVKDRLTGPAPAPAAPGPATRPAPAPVRAPEPVAADDDLSEINGIGPVYKTKLAESGITGFAGLADADATELSAKIEAPVSRIQAWIDAARRRRT